MKWIISRCAKSIHWKMPRAPIKKITISEDDRFIFRQKKYLMGEVTVKEQELNIGPLRREHASYEAEYTTLNLGPTHPATHGVFQNILTMDGEIVVDAEQTVGYIHRAFEKIAERRP